MAQIPVRHGDAVVYAEIDEIDYERCSKIKWSISGEYPHGYDRSTGEWVQLHRFIMNAPDGVLVDHKNRIKMDCRRENLRYATRQEQNRNIGKRQTATTSRWKGVHYYPDGKKKRIKRWQARIRDDNSKTVSLGYFETEIEAAAAYNRGAILYHGEFACLNDLSLAV